MALPRLVEREWLDDLSADNPRAIQSRRDLKRINALMRQAAIMANLLRGEVPAIIADIGTGDGTFMLRMARRFAAAHPRRTVLLVDRQPVVSQETCNAFRRLGWMPEIITADIFDFLKGARDLGITTNLFLHHFPDEALAELLARIRESASLFAACEPRRNRIALLASHLTGIIGCNDVTRHDAAASVRAGFSAKDLTAHWPHKGNWRLSENFAFPFTHCFVARRP